MLDHTKWNLNDMKFSAFIVYVIILHLRGVSASQSGCVHFQCSKINYTRNVTFPLRRISVEFYWNLLKSRAQFVMSPVRRAAQLLTYRLQQRIQQLTTSISQINYSNFCRTYAYVRLVFCERVYSKLSLPHHLFLKIYKNNNLLINLLKKK